MKIVVVTKADPEPGNMAIGSMNLYIQTNEDDPAYDGYLKKVEPFSEWLMNTLPREQAVGLLLNLRKPVFEVGEIMFLDEGGRELNGIGRKPDKWNVEVESVDSVEAAVMLSLQITEQREQEAREAQ